MKFSLSLLSICILSFILIYSCSTEEEESVAPVVQTPEPIPVKYTLTVSAAEGGTVSSEGGTYDEGTEIEIIATPNVGYVFGGWIGYNSTSASISLNLSANIELEAMFLSINSINNDPLLFNYDTSKSYIGELVDFYPSAFFASDVPQYIRESLNNALKTAADRYGKYGPVEFWSLGTEEAAAQELLNLYCERRDHLNHSDKQSCLIGMEDNFMDRAKVGRDAIQNGECRVDGSHSGGFQWGFHDMRTTYLMGFDDSFDCRPFGDDYFTIVHEYFHVVQLASVFNLESEVRRNRVAPNDAIWMIEGAAQYIGKYTVYKLQDEVISIFPSNKWTG